MQSVLATKIVRACFCLMHPVLSQCTGDEIHANIFCEKRYSGVVKMNIVQRLTPVGSPLPTVTTVNEADNAGIQPQFTLDRHGHRGSGKAARTAGSGREFPCTGSGTRCLQLHCRPTRKPNKASRSIPQDEFSQEESAP